MNPPKRPWKEIIDWILVEEFGPIFSIGPSIKKTKTIFQFFETKIVFIKLKKGSQKVQSVSQTKVVL
jgi:hypothetical protein